MAITHAPWAIAAVAGLWWFHPDVAAIGSAVLLLHITLAVLGSRITAQALQFDVTAQASIAGQDALSLPRESVSVEEARMIAERWVATQASRLGSTYKEAQRAGWRAATRTAFDLSTAIAIAIVATYGSAYGLSTGSLIAVCIVAFTSARTVSAVAAAAPKYARARAARRQLITLRAAKTSQGVPRMLEIPAPRMRGPIAAGVLATAATVAGVVVTALSWQIPTVAVAWGAVGTTDSTSVTETTLSEQSGRRANAFDAPASRPTKSPDTSKAGTVLKGRS
jgi:hypothetical protein